MTSKFRDTVIVVCAVLITAGVGFGVYLLAVGQAARQPTEGVESPVSSEANAATCKMNMKTVANAVQANHVRNRTSDYFSGPVDRSTVGPGNPLEDLSRPVLCPSDDSAYTVKGDGRSGFRIDCDGDTHTFYWENGQFLDE